LENLEEMEKLIDICDYPKVNQEYINHLSRSIKSNEIEGAIKSHPRKKKFRA
jgi:hypothetical protein